MLAGLAIILVAASVIAAIAYRDSAEDATPLAADPTAVATPEPGIAVTRFTTNVRSDADRFADVIAIVPEARAARLLGRSSDDRWVKIAYPPASDVEGWVSADAIAIDAAELAALDVLVVLAAPLPEPNATAATGEPLPDLTIADAFLLQDGRLAIALRNEGELAIVEALVPLNVSRSSGDILGVLRIGPTTLAPGASATVVTPVIVSETGSYIIELDRPDKIRESQEFNNIFTALLIATGS